MRKVAMAVLLAAVFAADAFNPSQNPAARPACTLEVIWDHREPSDTALRYTVYGAFGADPVRCPETAVAALAAATAALARERVPD